MRLERAAEGCKVADLKTVTHAEFEERLEQDFRLHVDESQIIDLKLTRVDPQGPAETESGLRRPFSLTFEAHSASLLPQRIYQVEHAALGRLELFLVPVGREGERVLYEAVFN
ncbi:MAG: hypothetical protein GY937_22555 [bacterium]|nr:hypothetical protein [bacterium]